MRNFLLLNYFLSLKGEPTFLEFFVRKHVNFYISTAVGLDGTLADAKKCVHIQVLEPRTMLIPNLGTIGDKTDYSACGTCRTTRFVQ